MQAEVLNVSCDVFKDVVNNNNFTVYFFPEDGVVDAEMGFAFCGTEEYIFCARIVDDSWVDFDTAFPVGTRAVVARRDDAIAQIVGIQAVPKLRRTPDGRPVSAPSFEDTGGLNPKWEGKLYTATAGAMNFFDEEVTVEKQLRGGWYEIMNDKAQVGDYVEQSVVDKNDVLGLFSVFGLTVGQDVLELKKYVKTEYVNPTTAGQRQVFGASSTFTLTVGLFLRVAYNSTGAEDVELKVTTLAYE